MRINSNYVSSSLVSANRATQSVVNNANRSFIDIVEQKTSEASLEMIGSSATAFDTFGVNAPDEVRQAWMEAEKEIGGHFAAGGLWISNDGEHAHATQIMIQRAGSWLKGEADQYNLLGNSVESAILFAEKAIYGIDNPLPGQPTRSIEVQQQVMKERAFYEAFLDKLRHLSE